MAEPKKPLTLEEREAKLLELEIALEEKEKSIDGRMEKMEKMMSSLESKAPVAQVQPDPIARSEKNTMMSSNEIPEEDLLPAPVRYWAWGRYHGLFGYTYMGQTMNTPYERPIEFRPLPAIRGKDSNGQNTRTEWCSVEIWSKKMVAWLEKHPEFNQVFFKSTGDLYKTDLSLTNHKLKSVMEVSRLNHHQIAEKLQQRGLSVSDDFHKMQAELIDVLAKEALHGQHAMSTEIASRNAKELPENKK